MLLLKIFLWLAVKFYVVLYIDTEVGSQNYLQFKDKIYDSSTSPLCMKVSGKLKMFYSVRDMNLMYSFKGVHYFWRHVLCRVKQNRDKMLLQFEFSLGSFCLFGTGLLSRLS